jgi:nucleotide-binding universal stress UspA family protein
MANKKILVPVDGSEYSLEILPHLMRFLNPNKSELVLLYVSAEPITAAFGSADTPNLAVYVDQEAAAIESAFGEAMSPRQQELEAAGFQVTTAVRYGEPTSEIERFIREEQIELVAMTTHGRTGLARMLLGSVAQYLVNHTHVPVLLHRPAETR